MIFVTGDTHGLHDFSKLHVFAKDHPDLTKSDYVIIAGDFGAVWSKATLAQNLQYYAELPFTVLFVDGNHENFDLLNTYSVQAWCGGKAQIIKSNIVHLMRGQVYEIEGKTVFTFGGATSIDKDLRVEGVNWWRQENPTFDELDEGIANLKHYNNKVDYIITHSCGQRALMYPKLRFVAGEKAFCPEIGLLSNFEDVVMFKHWYFGHFHIDVALSDKYTAIHNNIVRIAHYGKHNK